MAERASYSLGETLLEDECMTLCRARRTADHQAVVLKLMDPRRCQQRDAERLRREHAFAATLVPTAILKPLGLETFQGMLALVFEDFEGRPLEQLLGAPMQVERFLELAVGIARALAALHRQGVIHKDLKPANIFVHSTSREVRLAGLGFATRLPREPQALQPPLLIEGSLPYMSPEQTGHMSRALDSRSDLYSLGVVLYQTLTGRLPFAAHDALEWVHCHVARLPSSPRALAPELPETLNAMVMKLLSKTAEERYQSAGGLQQDLERCLQEWRATGTITRFTLGAHDTPDRLRLPQRLYGREAEIALLQRALAQVGDTGRSQLLLVSGFAGIGKSVLVQELHPPLVARRGLFASGKFDQLRRDAPYSTIVQAFTDLVRELLAGDEKQRTQWRERLQAALGANGRIITEVIAPVELLIGPQPPVPPLPPTETQNRFRMVFRRFIGVLARPGQPMTLFLDDLQWADSASLVLLEDLATHAEVRHLLLVGAYRDNEVSSAHPLLLALDRVRRTGAQVDEIVLGPLSRQDMTALVADALHCRREEAASLGDLIHRKTAGNPLFTGQFLSSLEQEHLLVFDARIQAWRWDVSRIEARGFSDSIVDLMIAKLRRLPPVTQQALQQLACLGGSSKAALLALALCRSEEQTQADLWPALREGLVLYQRGVYRFLHDRVQEAAYALLAEHARAARHLEIGRLMLAHLPQEALAEQVFDVVHQLNRGVRLIEDPEQKATLRRLNLRAGDKAMASGANSAARRYYAQAIDLLPPGCWSTGHEESFALHLKLSECEYLVGNFRRADELFNLLLAQARSNPEKARVYLLRVRLYQVAGKFPEAVEAGLAGLRLFGVSYPDTPQELEAATRAAMSEVAARLRDQGRDKLVQAPACTDADACAVMSLVADLVIAAYNVRRDLSMLIAADGVLLSFRYGSFSRSALAYAGCALAFICFFGELALACDLIDLALQLLEKLEDPLALGRVLFFEAAFVNHLRRPFATSLPIMERSFVTCLEAGDLAWAGFAAQAAVWLSLERGDSLDEVLAVARKYLSFARESHNDTLLQAVMLRQQLPVCLKGRTLQQASLDDSSFDEAACLAAFEKRGYVYGMILFHNVKQQVALFFGDYATAFRSRQRLTALLGADATGIMELPARVFLTLTVLSFWPQASAEEQRRFEEMVQGEVQRLELWARACPENGTCRHALVLAELARVQGRQLDAERLYDQAIQSARESRFVQFEALACELASQFYRSRGLQLIADMYLREARACYVRWGADGKVRQIEEQHPRLVEARRPEGGATLALHAEQLDLLSVVKASQTISSAIVSEELVGTLLRVILEQGGAQKGYLILPRGGALWLEAEAGLGDAGVETRMLGSLPARSSPLVPVTLIEHVALTREPVILDDAAGAAGQFAADAYVARQRPRSVLCLPVVRQAELVGLVYLENNLVQGAFTPARLAALTLIGAQAAISMQNALFLAKEREARVAAEEAERRSAFLAEAGTLLAESLDHEATLERLARLCVKSLADWCVIDIVEDGEIRRLAGAHADARLEPLLHQLRQSHPPRWGSPDPAVACLRTGEALVEDALGEERLRRLYLDEAQVALMQELQTRSLMVAPLVARGPALGALTLGAGTPGRYGPGELELAREVAHRAAIAVENALLHRETQRAVRLRDEFLTVASHELRTPMTSLMLSLQNLMRGGAVPPAPETVKRMAGMAQRQGERLTKLIGELLEVTRLEKGLLPLELQEVELVALVREIVDRYEPELVRAGCTVSLEAAAPVRGRWDASRLEQVLVNLLSNAMKFGTGAPIEVSVRAAAGSAWLAVRDHGIGIAPDQQQRIFERFARGVSAQRYGGLGLGLYICRSITQALGGQIRVESAPGQGACFTVQLPLNTGGIEP